MDTFALSLTGIVVDTAVLWEWWERVEDAVKCLLRLTFVKNTLNPSICEGCSRTTPTRLSSAHKNFILPLRILTSLYVCVGVSVLPETPSRIWQWALPAASGVGEEDVSGFLLPHECQVYPEGRRPAEMLTRPQKVAENTSSHSLPPGRPSALPSLSTVSQSVVRSPQMGWPGAQLQGQPILGPVFWRNCVHIEPMSLYQVSN